MKASISSMFLISIYKNNRINRFSPNWKSFFEDISYPVWKVFLFLVIDSVLYFFLFIIFNFTQERVNGSSILKWKDLFNYNNLKKLFSSEIIDLKISPQQNHFLTINSLTKDYIEGSKKISALNNLNFSIGKDEIIALIGANGSGKSTLLNILCGAILPSSGSVSIFGNSLTDLLLKGKIGVCFQENVLFNSLSIEEHFLLFGSFKGIPEIYLKEEINIYLDSLQLKEMMKNRAGDLSGGQKRKLCIALSLLGKPEFIIMDEPTAGVDIQARKLIWKTISSLENTTCIISSHSLEEAEVVCNKFIVLNSGKIQFFGTTTEFRNQYKCGYLLRLDCENEFFPTILNFVQSIIKDALIVDEHQNLIFIPICDQIPQLLEQLYIKKGELFITSISFFVEQLEDILIRMIQN